MINSPKVSIGVYKVSRAYRLLAGGVGFRMNYCPWCGKRVTLEKEWEDILAKEYDINAKGPDYQKDMDGNLENSNIPAEFLTSEWWKKRSL